MSEFEPIVLKSEITVTIEEEGDDTVALRISVDGELISGEDYVAAKLLKNGEIDWDWVQHEEPNIELAGQGGLFVDKFVEKYGDKLVETIKRRKEEAKLYREKRRKEEAEQNKQKEIEDLQKRLDKLKS